MELDDLSTYGAVRRLTNSDSPVKNPHFPSVWKIYWWNNYSWEEYSKVTFLLVAPGYVSNHSLKLQLIALSVIFSSCLFIDLFF